LLDFNNQVKVSKKVRDRGRNRSREEVSHNCGRNESLDFYIIKTKEFDVDVDVFKIFFGLYPAEKEKSFVKKFARLFDPEEFKIFSNFKAQYLNFGYLRDAYGEKRNYYIPYVEEILVLDTFEKFKVEKNPNMEYYWTPDTL
jgi:hypothetical protein